MRLITLAAAPNAEEEARLLAEAPAMSGASFPGCRRKEETQFSLPDALAHPGEGDQMAILAVDDQGRLAGLAAISHHGDVGAAFLQYLAAAPGRGAGHRRAACGKLQGLSETLGCRSLYYEITSDNASFAETPADLAQNKARLRFYEKFGARVAMEHRLWPALLCRR